MLKKIFDLSFVYFFSNLVSINYYYNDYFYLYLMVGQFFSYNIEVDIKIEKLKLSSLEHLM